MLGVPLTFTLSRYNDVVKQGDQLITKLQKYGQVVRLRGSERS
jgi:26S proteasome regulatory subunit N7